MATLLHSPIKIEYFTILAIDGNYHETAMMRGICNIPSLNKIIMLCLVMLYKNIGYNKPNFWAQGSCYKEYFHSTNFYIHTHTHTLSLSK